MIMLKNKHVTKRLFGGLFKIMKSINLSDNNINYVIRTLRGFLDDFSLYVNIRLLEILYPSKKVLSYY